MKCVSILACILVINATALATNYCSKKICRKGLKHIACNNDGKFAKTCPSDAKMVDITDPLKQVLLDAHNAKRNKIAGGGDDRYKPACRMATMQWDDELASVAAFNVKQCKLAHDKCRDTDTFKSSGQNLAFKSYYDDADDASELNDMVEMWYSEVKNSNQSYIDSYPENYSGPTIGHFTVMVADKNVRVGCAAATYSAKNQEYSIYLVACNYATTNIINYPIYDKCDEAATGCTTGTNPQYPSLCSVSEQYDVDK